MTMRSVMVQADQWAAVVVAREVRADSLVAGVKVLKIYSVAEIFQISLAASSVVVVADLAKVLT
jgi:hypothetical protein